MNKLQKAQAINLYAVLKEAAESVLSDGFWENIEAFEEWTNYVESQNLLSKKSSLSRISEMTEVPLEKVKKKYFGFSKEDLDEEYERIRFENEHGFWALEKLRSHGASERWLEQIKAEISKLVEKLPLGYLERICIKMNNMIVRQEEIRFRSALLGEKHAKVKEVFVPVRIEEIREGFILKSWTSVDSEIKFSDPKQTNYFLTKKGESLLEDYFNDPTPFGNILSFDECRKEKDEKWYNIRLIFIDTMKEIDLPPDENGQVKKGKVGSKVSNFEIKDEKGIYVKKRWA